MKLIKMQKLKRWQKIQKKVEEDYVEYSEQQNGKIVIREQYTKREFFTLIHNLIVTQKSKMSAEDYNKICDALFEKVER